MTHNVVAYKRRRIYSEDNPKTTDGLRHTKLFDLNSDCLREIFQRLDVYELVNLVDANLNDYDDTEAEINARSSSKNPSFEAAIQDQFMRIDGDDCFATNDPAYFSFIARVFRYFRSSLSQLSISYNPKHQRHNTTIEQIILKHSLEHLTEIVLDNADQCAFEDISQPFVNVKRLTFEGGYVSETLGNFNRWFPKLESLIFNEALYSDPKFIEMRFLNLKLLSVKNKHLCRCRKNNWYDNIDADVFILANENLKKFFALNSQLETLIIFQDKMDAYEFRDAREHQSIRINQDLLIFININIPRLHHLHLHMYEQRTFALVHNDTIPNFQNLSTLSVETSELYRLCEINIRSDQLVTLSLANAGKSKYLGSEKLSEFVGRFKSIKCLSIETLMGVRDPHFVNMIKGLCNLISLNISLSENDFSNDAIFCMSQFERLRVLQIRCSEIRLQHHQNILNGINRCGFMKDKKWRGVLGYQWANFIFEKY